MRFRKVLKATGDVSGTVAAPATPDPVRQRLADAVRQRSGEPRQRVAGRRRAGGQRRRPRAERRARAPPRRRRRPRRARPPPRPAPADLASVEQQRKPSRRRSARAAWAAASKLTDPADLATNPAAEMLEPFGTLTPDEVRR